MNDVLVFLLGFIIGFSIYFIYFIYKKLRESYRIKSIKSNSDKIIK